MYDVTTSLNLWSSEVTASLLVILTSLSMAKWATPLVTCSMLQVEEQGSDWSRTRM